MVITKMIRASVRRKWNGSQVEHSVLRTPAVDPFLLGSLFLLFESFSLRVASG